MQASFWTAEELDLGHDLHDWHDKMTENERFFILRAWPSALLTSCETNFQVFWHSSLRQMGSSAVCCLRTTEN
jgi:ribonucleotide reductase beta subunit family protein with ferritin-like domain